MFLKPFHVKSNAQVKGSDRKKLRARLSALYPRLSVELLAALVPGKGDMSVSRLLTHSEAPVACYLCEREPLLLESDGQLVPTVYSLWRAPDLLPVFTTHVAVVARLRAGADLMLPGVVVDRTLGMRAYGRLAKGDLVAINTEANRAAVAVGRAARSSDDMYMSGGRGKAVLVLHVVGDLLWNLGSRSEVPDLGVPSDVYAEKKSDADCQPVQGVKAEDSHLPPPVDNIDGATDGLSRLDMGDTSQNQSGVAADMEQPCDVVVDSPQAECTPNMDQLLYDAFRQAWKTSAKKLELPVLVSSFYALHMQPNSVHPLDVKKSSYKKISKFLEKMQNDSLVQVQELSKGVQSIVSVKLDHPELRGYKVQAVPVEEIVEAPDNAAQQRSHTKSLEKIEEVYIVSGNMAPLFRTLRIDKGTHLLAQEVRGHLTSYVKSKTLQNPENKNLVKVDEILATSLFGRKDAVGDSIPWTDLNQTCLKRMSPGYMIVFRGEPPQVRRGALPSVDLTTATRSGNKKVTFVVNLPVFGIDPVEFAHKCQVGVAASTSVSEAPNKPAGTVQVMVQGNQIRFIGKLLQQEYGLAKRFIAGLEKAPKK